MHRTIIKLFSKRVTIPQLSPTHSKAKVKKWIAKSGNHVSEYEPIMILECSPDLVTPGFRESENHKPVMIIDTQEEGIIKINEMILKTCDGRWLDVGTEIGIIDDGDPVDSDWIWQAYSSDEV